MYQYHDANGEFISLHDCRAAKASPVSYTHLRAHETSV